MKLCKGTDGMMKHVRRLMMCEMTDSMMGCAKRLKEMMEYVRRLTE
jgi:hypothetical protein